MMIQWMMFIGHSGDMMGIDIVYNGSQWLTMVNVHQYWFTIVVNSLINGTDSGNYYLLTVS